MLSPYINVSFLSGFDELVVSRGGEPGRFYEAVGLDRRVASGEAQLIPHDLFFQLLETTTIGLNFPDLALHLAQRQDMTVLAPLNPVLRQCVSVKDALETIIKYLKLIISGYQVEMEVQEDVVKLSFDVELPYVRASSVFQDYSLAIAVSVLHGLLGRSYPIRACYFIRAEANQNRIEAYARFFGCAVSFGNPTLALTVDKAILSQDINRLIEQIDRRIQQALYFSQESFTHLVSKTISFCLANGTVQIEDIAMALNCSSRTLQRRLLEQNTSYQALLDEVRFSIANQYLENTYYRLTDIAMLLGYSNASAFTRSYQRWSGVTPKAARERSQNRMQNTELGSIDH